MALDVLGEYPEGVYFVDLTSVTEPVDVVPAIARVLGVALDRIEPAGQLVETYFGDRSMLLVLDNLEQVTEAARAIGRLVSGCPWSESPGETQLERATQTREGGVLPSEEETSADRQDPTWAGPGGIAHHPRVGTCRPAASKFEVHIRIPRAERTVGRMSRLAGVVGDLGGFGPHDHVCWAFDDADEFRARAGRLLEEGLDLGEQVWYVGAGDVHALEDELRELPGMERALRRGAAKAGSVEAAYGVRQVVDPAAQVRAYATATKQAVAAGFTGLRVAADASTLVRTPEQLNAFARYEHLIDRYMLTAPFSALCAYQRSQVGEESIAALACMHPAASQNATPFWLHATVAGGCAAAIGGELDLATRDLLELALGRTDLQPHNGELILDATGLAFMDHRGLLQLVEHARKSGHGLALRTAHPAVLFLTKALGLTNVRVETPT